MTPERATLAGLRLSRGLSQEALAERVGVHPHTVGRWESGRSAPQPECMARLANELDVGIDDLRTLLAPRRRTARIRTSPVMACSTPSDATSLLTWSPTSTNGGTPNNIRPGEPGSRPDHSVGDCSGSAPTTPIDLERPDVKRRTFFTATAAAGLPAFGADTDAVFGRLADASSDVVAASSSPPPWALAATLARSSADSVALDHVENAVNALARAYPHTAPTLMLPSVSTLISHVNALLTDPMPLRPRRRATVAMGVLAGLAGSLWSDLGRPRDAVGYFDIADLAAHEAEAPDLAAWALATRSIATHHAGGSSETWALLTQAAQYAAAESSPQRRSWIAALTARAAAATGDTPQAHRALDSAHAYLDGASEPGTGTDFFDTTRLAGLVGGVYLSMRDTTRAAPALRDAFAKRASHDAKGRALLSLDIAICLAHDGDAEEATRVAVAALESARGTTVAPIVARARTLHADLAQLSGSSCARELDACLREAVRG